MKIIDNNNQAIENPDLEKGYLVPDSILIAHHDAAPAVEEQWHYEVTAVYPNGGRDVVRVVDVTGREAQAAWDEYEDVQRYIEYTPEEIAERDKPSQMDIIEAQISYTAMMTDTVLEVQ